jgi:hypothetical protein
MIEFTRKEKFRCAIEQFHFLLIRPDKQVQSYTASELADAIERQYDVKNGDPRLAWMVNFLRENKDVVLTVRNFWGV